MIGINMKIPFKKLNLGNAEVAAVSELIRSGMIGLGDKVFEFEKALAEYVGCKEVIAVDSCTSAIFLSLLYDKQEAAAMQDPSTEVGIPSMTVPLVAAAAIEAGRRIYYTDDVDWVGSAYNLIGTPVWDSAHQLERNQFLQMFGPLDTKSKLCFSFYPTKSIGSADGGAIATNDVEFAKWARSISTYGRNQGTKYGNSWDYEVELIGYKRHYTNLQAVICHEQLKRLDNTNMVRAAIRNIYNTAFGLKNKSLYLYRISVDNRDEFIKELAENGIEAGVHFKPLHMMKAYQGFQIRGDRKKVEDAYAHTLSLPFYDSMTHEEVHYIIDLVKNRKYK